VAGVGLAVGDGPGEGEGLGEGLGEPSGDADGSADGEASADGEGVGGRVGGRVEGRGSVGVGDCSAETVDVGVGSTVTVGILISPPAKAAATSSTTSTPASTAERSHIGTTLRWRRAIIRPRPREAIADWATSNAS